MTWTKLVASLIVAATVVAGTVHWRATAREDAARAAFPPEGRLVATSEGRVHVLEAGDGPAVVLIHGSMGNLRDFSFDLVGRLATRYRVIALDRPGLGWSDRLPPGREGIHDQARVLRAALAGMGVTRPILVGHSYGGAVALAWAMDAADEVAAVVTLAAPSHPWTTPLPPLYRVGSNPLGSALAVPLITAFVGADRVTRGTAAVFAPQPMPEGYAAHVGASLALTRAAFRANARQRATLLAEITAMAPRYPDFPVPLEMLHGTADTTVSIAIHAEAMLRDTARARLTRLEGVGHMPHHADPGAVIAAIDRAAARAGLR